MNQNKLISILKFRMGDDFYGVDISCVKEVVAKFHITLVPAVPEFILGVINLHSEIITVFDLKCFFGLGKSCLEEVSNLIVIKIEDSFIAILVNEIGENIDIDVDEVKMVAPSCTGDISKYIKGRIELEYETLTLLDLNEVLKSEKVKILEGDSDE